MKLIWTEDTLAQCSPLYRLSRTYYKYQKSAAKAIQTVTFFQWLGLMNRKLKQPGGLFDNLVKDESWEDQKETSTSIYSKPTLLSWIIGHNLRYAHTHTKRHWYGDLSLLVAELTSVKRQSTMKEVRDVVQIHVEHRPIRIISYQKTIRKDMEAGVKYIFIQMIPQQQLHRSITLLRSWTFSRVFHLKPLRLCLQTFPLLLSQQESLIKCIASNMMTTAERIMKIFSCIVSWSCVSRLQCTVHSVV